MIVLYAYAFYLAFALCISVYRLWLGGRLNLLNKLLFAPVIIAFCALDVAINWTVLILIWGRPPKGYSISERFEVYHKAAAPTPRAKAIATWTCVVLLNTIDPTGDHC